MLISCRDKMKARADVGRGGEGPVCYPGSELLLGGSARVARGYLNGMKKKKNCEGL